MLKIFVNRASEFFKILYQFANFAELILFE